MNDLNRKLILSGIQPTGIPHIGNYISLFRYSNLKGYRYLYCIADLHSITNNNIIKLKNYTRLIIAFILSIKISNESIIFTQSSIKTQGYLYWLINCLSKNKEIIHSSHLKKISNYGSYSYPCLMAADILMYRVNEIIIGKDQISHMEFTRNISNKLNLLINKLLNIKDYNYFPYVNSYYKDLVKIMSLQDPFKKMSKSDLNNFCTINILDNYNIIKEKILSSKTDNYNIPYHISELYNREGVKNLLYIYSKLLNIDFNKLLIKIGGIDIKVFKLWLIDLIYFKFSSFKSKILDLLKYPDYLDYVLKKNIKLMNEWSNKTINHMKYIFGFL